MTTYIYTRVSTDKQEVANQLAELRRRYPEASIVEETASGAKNRPRLDTLLSEVQDGDTLVVYALDRLGRRCGELVTLLDDLGRRKVNVVSMREGIDFSSLAGKFMGQLFAALAELERGMISERTKSALRAKKEAGVQLGRPKTVTDRIASSIKQKASKGMRYREISAQTGVSIATVSRVLNQGEDQE